MQCVELKNGFVFESNAPNGDMNQCAFILQTPQELNHVRLEPFAMDTESAIQISVAVMLIWSIAWLFKQFGKVVNQ